MKAFSIVSLTLLASLLLLPCNRMLRINRLSFSSTAKSGLKIRSNPKRKPLRCGATELSRSGIARRS